MSSFTRTKQRSSGGTGVVCAIGMLNFTVDLAPVGRVNKVKDTAFNYVCPDDRHAEPERVEQRYICVSSTDAAKDAAKQFLRDHFGDAVEEFTAYDLAGESLAEGVIEAMEAAAHHSDQDDLPGFRSGELDRARRTDLDDDTSPLIKAAADEIIAAKVGDLEAGGIDFKVHQAWEVEAVTLPGKGAFRVRPALTKKRTVRSQDMEVYAALVELLTTCPHLALVGTMRVRDARATYRLGVWGSQLVLTELALPSDLAERDQIEATVADDAVKQLRILIESRVEDFDESVHRFDAKAAVEELVERNRAIAAGEVEAPVLTAVPELVDDGQVIDLTAMLAQMIEAA